MELQEKIRQMKGVLTVNVVNRSCETIATHIWDNLIVNTGYQAAAQALGGYISGDATIVKIGMGINAAPPTMADTLLVNHFTKSFTSVEYPAPVVQSDGTVIYSVQFNFTIDFLEAVGMVIYEWGLLTQDGRLFSRLTRAPIEKTNEMQLVGHWQINI